MRMSKKTTLEKKNVLKVANRSIDLLDQFPRNSRFDLKSNRPISHLCLISFVYTLDVDDRFMAFDASNFDPFSPPYLSADSNAKCTDTKCNGFIFTISSENHDAN